MTGFGVADGPVKGGRLQFEIRTVNHKHFSVQIRLPGDVQGLEADLREALRKRLERGHIALSGRWLVDPAQAPQVRVNVDRAREIMGVLGELKTALGLPGDLDFAFIARQPDVLVFNETADRDTPLGETLPVLDAAVDAVLVMREREGEALAAELGRQLATLSAHLERVAGRAPRRLIAERDRLRVAVAELLDRRPLDENRLAQEIALIAERLDITEEMTRLTTHIAASRAALGESAPVGRRLGFLGQEMLREINTIGSKANDAEIAQAVIDMKGELEKFREQVENIE
jgi:uncharacterized protein (TIGR00255 family)